MLWVIKVGVENFLFKFITYTLLPLNGLWGWLTKEGTNWKEWTLELFCYLKLIGFYTIILGGCCGWC